MEYNYNFNKIFISIDKKHQIDISIIDDVSWFNIDLYDNSDTKTFVLLLKDVLSYLSSNNIKYIKQIIYSEDLKYFTKSSFVQISDNEYTISTNIVDFLSEITSVLGIKKL